MPELPEITASLEGLERIVLDRRLGARRPPDRYAWPGARGPTRRGERLQPARGQVEAFTELARGYLVE